MNVMSVDGHSPLGDRMDVGKAVERFRTGEEVEE